MTTQREHKQSVEVGPGFGQVTTVADWYRNGHFATDDEARGAFELAHQQALDGMGSSVAAWMGLTQSEFDKWMRDPKWLPWRRR